MKVIKMEHIKQELKSFHQRLLTYHIPRWEELPDIELYMDQVIGLMEKYLSVFLKTGEDKLITPSMINNYVKMAIIPPPVKKKYSRTHLAYLIMVILLKQVLSISEIKTLIARQLEDKDIVELFHHFCQEQEQAFQAMASRQREEDFASTDSALQMAALAGAGKTLAQKILTLQIQPPVQERPEEPAEENREKENKQKKKKEQG